MAEYPAQMDKFVEIIGGSFHRKVALLEAAQDILESIGGAIFEQNLECRAPFGRYIIFGSIRGPGKPFEPRRLMSKAQSMTGLYLPFFFQKPELLHPGLTFLVDRALDGALVPPVAKVLPRSQTAEGPPPP
jgi:NADPH2:quinone reductase